MDPKSLRLVSHLGLFIKDVAFDVFHSLDYWRHNLKGNRVKKNLLKRSTDYNPVILVQGFMGTRGVLNPLEKFLRKLGHDVISIDFGIFNVGDIRESAHHLATKIERFLKRHNRDYPHHKVDIIGHSMGGLIALYYIKRLGGHNRVERLVTLGAPFQGTRSAYLGMVPFGIFSPGLWQMRPGSSLVKSLQSNGEEGGKTEVVSIAAKYDTICPPSSCQLAGARNETLPVGHASLLMDLRVFNLIAEILNHKRNERVIPFRRKRV